MKNLSKDMQNRVYGFAIFMGIIFILIFHDATKPTMILAFFLWFSNVNMVILDFDLNSKIQKLNEELNQLKFEKNNNDGGFDLFP